MMDHGASLPAWKVEKYRLATGSQFIDSMLGGQEQHSGYSNDRALLLYGCLFNVYLFDNYKAPSYVLSAAVLKILN